MAAVGRFQLFQEIVNLSVANNWSQAVKEWSLHDIEMLDPGEFDQCLCGHNPIRELCHIRNSQNGCITTVGNHCIEKFNKHEDAKGAVFESVPKMIRACKRIMKDPVASANEELIDYAENAGVFTEKNADFYRDIRETHKNQLSSPRKEYKKSLNHKLLFQVILSVRACYHRLKVDPLNETAGPRLLNVAFQKGVITQKDRDFYIGIWDRAITKLSNKQVPWRQNINNRIIEGLKGEYDYEKPRGVGAALALTNQNVNNSD